MPPDFFRRLSESSIDDAISVLEAAGVSVTIKDRDELAAAQPALRAVLRSLDRAEERTAKLLKVFEDETREQAVARARYQEFSVHAARINEHLSARVRLSVTLDWAPVGCHAALVPIATDLVGVAWLQVAEFARGMTNQRAEKVCERCGTKFTPRRKGSVGAPVRFCSTKCRMAAAYASRGEE